mgnify:CR=1 FL=1
MAQAIDGEGAVDLESVNEGQGRCTLLVSEGKRQRQVNSGASVASRRWWWSKDEEELGARTGFHGAGRGAAKEQEADEVPYGRLRGSIGDERVMARTAGRRQGTLGEGARLRRRGFQGSRGAGLGDEEL